MAMVINSNIQSLNAQRNLSISQADQNQAMERLTSGKRINSAADDAAGLAISSRMTSQIKGLDQAVRNANDGISLMQTAEGALEESTNILQRMRELAIQSSNGIFTDNDRGTLDAEVQQLVAELDRISETTSFNGKNILDGSLSSGISLQVGAEAGQTISFSIAATNTATLGLGSTSSDLAGDRLTSALTFGDGDIQINGQALEAFTGTADNENLDTLIANINDNVQGVSASGLNVVEGTTIGTGVIGAGDSMIVTLHAVDGGSDTDFTISTATNSVEELAAAINAKAGGALDASVGEDGKLALSNSTGATIEVAYTGSATSASSGIGAAVYQGSLALTSDDGGDISVTTGASGTTADLNSLGFSEVTAGNVQGGALSTGAQGTALATGDLSINGVGIAASATTAGLQGKVDNINAVSGATGVVASAQAEQSYAFNAAAAGVEVTGANAFVAGTTSFEEIHFVGANAPVGQTLTGTVTFNLIDSNGTNSISLEAATYADGDALVAAINGDLSAGATSAAYLDNNGNLAFRDTVTGGALAINTMAVNAASNADDAAANALFGFDIAQVAGGAATYDGSGAGFSLNGVDIDFTTEMQADGSVSATDIASKVNAAGVGVTAYVDDADKLHFSSENNIILAEDTGNSGFVTTLDTGANLNAGTLNTAATVGSLAINGFEVGSISLTDIEAAVTTINAQQSNTGVVASVDDNGQLQFSGNQSITLDAGQANGAASGRVLGINFVDTTTNNGVLDTQTVNAGIDLRSVDSSRPISIEATANGFTATGLKAMNTDLSASVSGASLSSISIATAAGATSAIESIDNALTTVNNTRSDLGAVTNRLDFTINNLSSISQNTSAARSRIEDADFAQESAALSRAQVLQQAGTAMLAQANAQPQQVLSLLQ